MNSQDIPEDGDFVEVTFEGEYGNQSPVKGVAREVDDFADTDESKLMFVVEDPNQSRDVLYAEGVTDGEEWATVSIRNSNIQLGENADWRRLE